MNAIKINIDGFYKDVTPGFASPDWYVIDGETTGP